MYVHVYIAFHCIYPVKIDKYLYYTCYLEITCNPSIYTIYNKLFSFQRLGWVRGLTQYKTTCTTQAVQTSNDFTQQTLYLNTLTARTSRAHLPLDNFVSNKYIYFQIRFAQTKINHLPTTLSYPT